MLTFGKQQYNFVMNERRTTMTNEVNQQIPESYAAIVVATKEAGFTMPSDILTCSLLRTLACSKPSGRFLELGTGTGLSTAWLLSGMDAQSSLISIDIEAGFLNIARQSLGGDERLELIESDAGTWIENNRNSTFDYIFADTWHGKYLLLEEVLAMLNKGGLYIIDDMSPQDNWPNGHENKVADLIERLATRTDIFLTKQVWATGIIVAVKK